MKDTKTREEKFIEELIRIYGSSNFILVDKDTGDITELPYGSSTNYHLYQKPINKVVN